MRLGAPRAWLSAVLFAAALGAPATACRRGNEALGLPDAYLLFAPARDEASEPRRSPSGLPLVEAVPLDDPRAVPYHKLFAVGFPAEMLRSDYLLKQLVRDVAWQGKHFPPAARAAAGEPTVLVLQSPSATTGPGAGLALKGFFGGAHDHAGVGWLPVTDDPERDSALSQTVTAKLARRVATTLAGGGDPGAAAGNPLVDGYTSAMEVIAREWRVGTGPQGALAPDAGTAPQREIFAAVRQNRFALEEATGQPRPAADLLRDPGVAATVLYRMAQAKGVGHRIAPAAIYAPFVSERVPDGVSPAAVLGPFRNFQAKLYSVWARAILRGAPPRDIADLVAAYAEELPGERTEAIRLFVVTTFGATVKPGGVAIKSGAAADALPELAALAAEVAAGRRSIRAALTPAAAANSGK